MQDNRPTIGIALSGGASRAIAQLAILEVLREHDIPIDIIVACSSGGIAATAYAVGTDRAMKDMFFNMKSISQLLKLWSTRGSRGGLFHFRNPGAQTLFNNMTLGKSFEDLPIKMGFTATDIETGELITLSTGPLDQALKATIAVPGFFEPTVIDNRILVDGGLVNIVPTVPAKQMGADIVIGVDVALAKFMFQRKMWFWRPIRRVRRILGINYIQHGIIEPLTSKIITSIQEQMGVKKRRVPNAFRILSWAVDHSFDIEKEWDEENRACDLMISPTVQASGKIGLDSIQWVYSEGRRAGLEALPKIKELIKNYKPQTERVPEKVLSI